MGRLIGIVIVVLLIVAGIWWYQSGGQQKVEQVAQQASDAAGQAAQQVAETAEKIAEQASETAGQLSDQAGQATQAAGEAVQQASDAAGQVADGAQALVVGGVDLGKQLGEAFEGLKSSLAGITDAASAQAQLPTLQELQSKVDGLTAAVEGLPAEGRSALATLVAGSLPTLRSTAEQIAAIEGVGPIVKPTLDAILAKLDTWSKAPA